jgi:hypothetical protein
MRSRRFFHIVGLSADVAIEISYLAPTLAQPRDLRGTLCEELWYARNRIYARKWLLLQHRAGALRFRSRMFSTLRAIARLGKRPR